MPKGSNPNSHHNKPKLGVTEGKVTLTPEQWAVAEEIGGGNKSKGLRSLIDYAITHGLTTETIAKSVIKTKDGSYII